MIFINLVFLFVFECKLNKVILDSDFRPLIYMISTITHGIEISVQTHYYAAQSSPRQGHYFFIYEITISNKTEYSVQLLKRHWNIVDGFGQKRVVKGDGVIGETPIIEPQGFYRYNSGCDFETEMGKMNGFFSMRKLVDKTLFDVVIPEFIMEVPAKLN